MRMGHFVVAGLTTFGLCLQLGAAGNKDWSGREPHPAVVNPVCGCADGTMLDLGGEWTFAKGGYSADRSQFFRRRQLEKTWSDAIKIRVPGNWETQGVGAQGGGSILAYGLLLDRSRTRHGFVRYGTNVQNVKFVLFLVADSVWSGQG